MYEAQDIKTGDTSGANARRDQILQQLAGVHAVLDRKGVSAAFYLSAKKDPIGDMGFLGSLLFHAITGAPFGDLMNDYHFSSGLPELDSTLTLGTMESAAASSETKECEAGSIKSSFYPLGRNKKSMKDDKKPRAAAAGGKSRFAPDNAQAELGFMFELMDALNNLDGLDVGQVADKRQHLITRTSANPGYNGVERRRRSRPDGMFNA
jgi:hypothetical protein